MKKKDTIKSINDILWCVKQAALLKGDKKGRYHYCTTKECVDYQLKHNPNNVLQIFNYNPVNP